MADRFEFLLSDSWDDFNAGTPAPVEADRSIVEPIAQFTSIFQTPTPGAARERARQRVFESIAVSTQENTMTALSVPSTFPGLNGRGAIPPARPGARTTAPRRWALVSLAAAIILILASLGGWMGYDRYFSGGGTPHHSVIPATQLETDWPMYRGDPARNGAQDGYGPRGTPSPLWTYDTGASVFRSPAVTGGVAYVGASDGIFYALDAATGANIWTFTGDGSMEMTPAVLGGVVYVPSENGTLYAIDAESGDELWTFAKPLSDYATPSYDGGLLFAGSLDGNLYAIDPATGAEAWHFTTGGPLSRCTAAKDGVVYTGSEDGFLYAVDAATGKELWKYDTKLEIVGTPTVANGLVYVVRPGGTLLALDAASGSLRFSIEPETDDGFTPVSVTGDTIFAGSQDGNFYALDARTGETKWTFQTGDEILGTPAIVGGVLYGASYDNHIYALEASTGRELWRFELDGAINFGPSVANGVVYASTDNGTVYAIGGSGAAPSPESAETVVVANPIPPATPVATDGTAEVWRYVDPGANTGPSDVILGLDGNLLVVEAFADRIAVLSPDGQLLEYWGELGTGDGQFHFSRRANDGWGSIAIGPDGSIYVADSQNRRIQKFDADRQFLLSFGTAGTDPGEMEDPIGVAVDSDGNVYVVDDKRNDIQKFDADGNYLSTIAGKGTAPGQLADTGTIGIGLDDPIWNADFGNNRIQQFASDGTFLQAITSEHISQPTALAVDSDGRIFVSNFGNNLVVVLDADGQEIATIDGSESGGAPFGGPTGLSLDGQGNLYVASFSSDDVAAKTEAVWKLALPAELRPATVDVQSTPVASPAAQITFSPIGEITGGDDPLYGPDGIAFDDAGNLYVVDTRNERVVVFDPNGVALRTWGEPGAGPGQFDFSESDFFVGFIAIRGNDVYVADTRNHRIQQFTLDGAFVRTWGEQGSGDGQFDEPSGVAIDKDGRVWVGDYGNNRVQIFNGDGNFIEVWGSSSAASNLLLGPNAVTFDQAGNVYVASQTNQAVYQFDSEGNLIGELGGLNVFTSPWAVAIDDSGHIVVSDNIRHRVQVFSADGNLIESFGEHGSNSGQFSAPGGVTLGPDGNLYVSDSDNNRIQIFSIETPAS